SLRDQHVYPLRRHRVPMTASRLRPSRPTDKWQHRLSSRTPTCTELASRQLIQSANRNTVESNETKRNNKSKRPMKEKQRTNLDTSDLLIESRLVESDSTLSRSRPALIWAFLERR